MKLSVPVVKGVLIYNNPPAEDNQNSYTTFKNVRLEAKESEKLP